MLFPWEVPLFGGLGKVDSDTGPSVTGARITSQVGTLLSHGAGISAHGQPAQVSRKESGETGSSDSS